MMASVCAVPLRILLTQIRDWYNVSYTLFSFVQAVCGMLHCILLINILHYIVKHLVRDLHRAVYYNLYPFTQ